MLSLSGYDVQKLLGEGGHAPLFRAIRKSDGSPVLLKVSRRALNPSALARLRHEYQLTRDLNVAGLLRPQSLEEHSEGLALVLEDPGGAPLRSLLHPGGLELAAALRLALSLAETLGGLRRNGIIHKDISPDGVLVDPASGQARLTDFGIATRLSQESQTDESPRQLEGTLAYMSPEQTGRMNRAVDYRADFYSLGVTLYELLTGRLPFQATDAMELVHSHIARRPTPLHAVRPTIPHAVSDIVMKLLSKAAEDRYQSAAGRQADLAECLAQLDATGKIEPFLLGRTDLSDSLHIPQKLYGREAELETLRSAFDRVCRGRTELMLVAGYSGIGKSSLVRELQRPILGHRGYFISGKLDQYRRNVPYTSLIEAFGGLIRQLLAEGEDRVASWRNRLRAALEPNGQVLTEVIPNLELLI
jgi:serine/threonine protein kinase